jgi:hypothetical protein
LTISLTAINVDGRKNAVRIAIIFMLALSLAKHPMSMSRLFVNFTKVACILSFYSSLISYIYEV